MCEHFRVSSSTRAMAFAQLAYRESLRDIETCLSAQPAKLYHMGVIRLRRLAPLGFQPWPWQTENFLNDLRFVGGDEGVNLGSRSVVKRRADSQSSTRRWRDAVMTRCGLTRSCVKIEPRSGKTLSSDTMIFRRCSSKGGRINMEFGEFDRADAGRQGRGRGFFSPFAVVQITRA